MDRKLQIIRIKEQRVPERFSTAAERLMSNPTEGVNIPSGWDEMVEIVMMNRAKEKECIY